MTITYKKSSAGIYEVGDDGYNFKDDVDGFGDPVGWDSGELAKVIAAIREHSKVVFLNQTIFMFQALADKTQGTVEFYMESKGGVNNSTSMFLEHGTDDLLSIVIVAGVMRVARNGGSTTIVDPALSDTWYHISIDFDCVGGYNSRTDGALASDTFRVYINGTKYGDFAFVNAVDHADKITFNGGNAGQGSHFDAIAYSWDPTYDIGDNKGLEVSVPVSGANIYEFKWVHPIESWPTATATISQDEIINIGNKMELTSLYTSSGSTITGIVFEGVVKTKGRKYPPELTIVNEASEMDKIRPKGVFSGRTDEILTEIINVSGNYLKTGILSQGAAMGSISFAGDKTLTNIAKDFSKTDRFTFYTNPTGAFYYNSANILTDQNIDNTSGIWDVDAAEQMEIITKVEILGGFVSGIQASGSADDAAGQTAYGIYLVAETDSSLLTNTLCDEKAAQIIEYGNPLKVWFDNYNTGVGFKQPGENDLFKYNGTGMESIPEDNFIINGIVYNGKSEIYSQSLTSALFFKEKEQLELVQENSLQIQQVAETVVDNSDYQTEQHYRQLSPSLCFAESLRTLGLSNTSWDRNCGINHGPTSLTNSYYVMDFRLPDDYVEGEDLILRFEAFSSAANETYQYYFHAKYCRHGGSYQTAIATYSSTFAGDPTAWEVTTKDVTIDGTNLLKDDVIAIQFGMKDFGASIYVYSKGHQLLVPVNGRD